MNGEWEWKGESSILTQRSSVPIRNDQEVSNSPTTKLRLLITTTSLYGITGLCSSKASQPYPTPSLPTNLFMPAGSSYTVAGQSSSYSSDRKRKRPCHYRSSSQSDSESSSSLSDVDGDPNDPTVKMILEKKRKAKNQKTDLQERNPIVPIERIPP